MNTLTDTLQITFLSSVHSIVLRLISTQNLCPDTLTMLPET